MYRILVFTAHFYPRFGGYEKGIYQLFKRLVDRGCKVDLITCNTDKQPIYEEFDGISITRIPAWDILNGTYPIPKPTLKTLQILWKLYKTKYDMISTHTRFFLTSLLGLVFAKITGTPLIHTERGASHTIHSNKAVALVSRLYDHTIGTLIVKYAWKTSGLSRASYDFLKHLGAKEPAVIHDGVDTNLFIKKETALKKKLGLDNRIIITFVGRLVYLKGVQDVITIFPQILNNHGDVIFLIVGDGPYKRELKRLAPEIAKNNILFLGQKSEHEVVDIMNITDILVHPSYTEGFGLSIVEAGAIGIPAVAAGIEGVKDLIQDYENGLLFTPGDNQALKDKICELIENKELRFKLGKNARELYINQFNWQRVVDNWIKEFGFKV